MATHNEQQLDRAVAATIAVEDASAAWFELVNHDGVEAAFMSTTFDAWIAASEKFLIAVEELHWTQVAAQHAAGNGRGE